MEDIAKYRSKEGGHIFFRPAALIPFTKAVVRILEKNPEINLEKVIETLHSNIFWIQNDIWNNVLWNPIKHEMIMGNSKLVELLFMISIENYYLHPKRKNMHGNKGNTD